MLFRKLAWAVVFIINFGIVSAACYLNQQEVDCGYFFKTTGSFFILSIVFLLGWIIFAFRMIFDGYAKMAQYPDLFDYKWALKWMIINIISLGFGALVYYLTIYRKYKNPESRQKLLAEKATLDSDWSIAANHFRKLSFPWNWINNILFLSFIWGYADGGKLLIQNSKLIFRPHSLNLRGGYWETNLRDIKKVTLCLGATIQVKQLFVKTDSGEDKFIIWESQKQELLQRLKRAHVEIEEVF